MRGGSIGRARPPVATSLAAGRDLRSVRFWGLRCYSVKQGRRCSSFGRAFGRSRCSSGLAPRNSRRDGKEWGMIRAAGRDEFVLRQPETARLGPFLQRRFRVAGWTLHCREQRRPKPVHECRCSLKPAIEIDRGDHCLAGVGQDRWIGGAARRCFGTREDQMSSQSRSLEPLAPTLRGARGEYGAGSANPPARP